MFIGVARGGAMRGPDQVSIDEVLTGFFHDECAERAFIADCNNWEVLGLVETERGRRLVDPEHLVGLRDDTNVAHVSL